jgi:hypothetical protein
MRRFVVTVLLTHRTDTEEHSIQIVILRIQNHKHEKRREAIGKTGKVIDKSMSVVQAGDDDIDSKTTANNLEEDRSLDDATDWQNEDFVYVY